MPEIEAETTEPRIGQELVDLVEYDIAAVHLSDAIDNLPPEKVFALARGSLRKLESAASKIRRFLRKHGEQP